MNGRAMGEVEPGRHLGRPNGLLGSEGRMLTTRGEEKDRQVGSAVRDIHGHVLSFLYVPYRKASSEHGTFKGEAAPRRKLTISS